MARIFLSYSREDRDGAQRLVRVLTGGGHEVWWDRQICGGAEFATEIEAALDKADAIVVAWSAHSIQSRWVRDEAAIGGDSGKLLPVSLDGSQPPIGFRQFHTLNLDGWKGSIGDERTSELLSSIERRVNDKSAAPADVAVPQPTRRMARLIRLPLWAISTAIGALLVIRTSYLLPKKAPANSEVSAPTLALLPFTSVSLDPALTILASQARDSTAHTLSDSGMPIRLVDRVPAPNSDVDYLMFGEVSGTAGGLIATVRLEDAEHRQTVWSRRFEVERREAAVLPDRIGAQIAGTLGWAGALRVLDQR